MTPPAPVWNWRFEAADGSVPAEPAPPRGGFPSQADAESWVGESWKDLLGHGVDGVTLLCDGEVIYGPMSLRPLE